MARGELVLRLVAVGGLATCTVCSALVAWKAALKEMDALDERRCPVCAGSLAFNEDSLAVEVVVEPA